MVDNYHIPHKNAVSAAKIETAVRQAVEEAVRAAVPQTLYTRYFDLHLDLTVIYTSIPDGITSAGDLQQSPDLCCEKKKGGTPNMCYIDATQPYILPLEHRTCKDGRMILIYSLLLGKATTLRNGKHRSMHNFTYPIGHTVYDPHAIVGHHEHGLHFTASPASAHLVNSFGSHRLAVLPAPQLWRSLEQDGHQNRCWHSAGGITFLCVDCENIEFDVLTNPDFLRDLKISRSFTGRIPFSDLCDSVWRQYATLRLN
jgi:hypothetical protein